MSRSMNIEQTSNLSANDLSLLLQDNPFMIGYKVTAIIDGQEFMTLQAVDSGDKMFIARFWTYENRGRKQYRWLDAEPVPYTDSPLDAVRTFLRRYV